MGSVLFRFFRVVFLLHLFHPHKLQIQVVNQHPDLFMDLRGEVLRHGGEGSIGQGIGGTVPAYEPVRNVDVGFVVFRLAVFDQEVGHGVSGFQARGQCRPTARLRALRCPRRQVPPQPLLCRWQDAVHGIPKAGILRLEVRGHRRIRQVGPPRSHPGDHQ